MEIRKRIRDVIRPAMEMDIRHPKLFMDIMEDKLHDVFKLFPNDMEFRKKLARKVDTFLKKK